MRRIPEERFGELVDAAVEVFIERGYRRTQMADVAAAVGVAKGTLYGYVESKEALFALCVGAADREGRIEKPEHLPIPTPKSGALSVFVKQRISEESTQPLLEAASGRDRAGDPRGELEAVLGELYDVLSANRRGIKLIDRCLDHPELGPIWQETGREGGRASLRRYLEQRMASGQIRRVPNVRLLARITLETLVTWAVHIHWDRAPEAYDPDEAREHVIRFLIAALLPVS